MTHHSEFICPLRGLIFNPTGCPTHPPHWYGPVGGTGLVADSPTMWLVVLGYMVPVAENNPDQPMIKMIRKESLIEAVLEANFSI